MLLTTGSIELVKNSFQVHRAHLHNPNSGRTTELAPLQLALPPNEQVSSH